MSTEAPPKHEHPEYRSSEQLARRFGGALAEWLVTAAIDDVAELLRSADKGFLKFVLGDLGLRRRWQQMQFKSGAYVSLAHATISAFNGIEPPHRAMLAARIVFTWWGRRALFVFSDFPSGRGLEQVPLTDRYADAVSLLALAGEEELARKATETLDRSASLDLLFVALWEAGSRHLSGQEFRSSLGLGEARTDAGQLSGPEPTRPDSGGSAVSLNADPTPASVETVPPVTCVLEPAAPVVGGSVDPALLSLRDLLWECNALTGRISELLRTGSHSEAGDSFRLLGDARAAADSEIRRVQSELESSGTPVPSVPSDIYASQACASDYLAELTGALHQASSQVHLRILAEKTRLIARFEAAGLAIPSEVEETKSLIQLASVADEWHERLTVAELFVELQQWPAAPPSRFTTLRPVTRMALFERLLSLPSTEVSTMRLLDWAIDDFEAMNADSERAMTLLSALIVNSLDKYLLTLPANTWTIYGQLGGPASATLLFSSDLGSVVSNAVDADLIDIAALEQLPGFPEAAVPGPVANAVMRHTFESLPNSTSVRDQAALALKMPLDTRTLTLFIERLIEQGHYQSATALAILAVRSQSLITVPRRLGEALARTLIEAVVDRPDQRDLVRQLLEQDSEWLTDTPDMVATLLFLVAETGAERPLTELPFQAPEVLEAAEAKRPALVRRWLLERRLSDDSAEELVRREELLRKGVTALIDWDRDTQRPSTYTNWLYAADYQRLFNRRLRDILARLDVGREIEDIEADEWIQDASDGSERLPLPEGRARQNMIGYLGDQRERLSILAQCRAILPRHLRLRAALAHRPIGLREALESELRAEPNNSPLLRIYAQALAEVLA